jgi:uncharacterized membrane protein YphA (DoxX/SURF4 family)
MYRRVKGTQDARLTQDISLLGARIGLAWVFIYNGGGKLFGLFGGGGVHQASIFFGTVAGLHPAVFFTIVAGITEFSGSPSVSGCSAGLGPRRWLAT